MSSEPVPSVGPIPPSFPRDTVEFALHGEHMAVGQVLEPLISADRNGNIIPGIAEKWEILNGGLNFVFHLRGDLKFSNGHSVTAKDVIFSLNRHRLNPKSQSYPLLSNIKGIVAVGENVRVTLSEPQVAILKILSRDQLGIVPENWVFNKEAIEPYTGTGPYRLVKENGDLYFIRNQNFRTQSEIHIDKWKVVFTPPVGKTFDKLPDYVPSVPPEALDVYKAHNLLKKDEYQTFDVLSFIQNSAWWNPDGLNYANPTHRKIKMGIIRQLFAAEIKEHQWKAATGLIPFGVAGYLPEPRYFKDITREDVDLAARSNPSVRELTVSIPDYLLAGTLESQQVSRIERELGIHLKILKTLATGNYEPDSTKRVDIQISRWAGGFNDPEGFLPIITDIISTPLAKYLGADFALLADASTEQDWTIRSQKYRKFNQTLVDQERFVPGWKTQAYSIIRKGFYEDTTSFRYTPRLTDIRKTNEK